MLSLAVAATTSPGLLADQEISELHLRALSLSYTVLLGSKPYPCLVPEITRAERVQETVKDPRGKEAGKKPGLSFSQSSHSPDG